MSERLRELVKKRLLELGDNALSKLAIEAELSPSLVNDIKNGHIPLPKNTLKLAKACGCSEKEALAIAQGAASKEGQRTA